MERPVSDVKGKKISGSQALRHCERSVAIHEFKLHGLPRFARSDGDCFIIRERRHTDLADVQ
jgi:hypothetical protein